VTIHGSPPANITDDLYVHPDQVAVALEHLINDDEAAQLAETFKALSDPTRVRIIAALAHTELCVYDLTAVVGLTQSAVSHQLRLLRTMRLVKSRRDGRHIYYQLDDAHIHDLFHRGLDHVMHG
jgi:ArsR family transcriptional regulator, lead/cadmium/zinc/bismuth-responsive transcriptional repressor